MNTSLSSRAFGWNADRPDFRDHKAAQMLKLSPLAQLPPSADLRAGFGPCYDQKDIGSCTANAIAGALEYDRRKQTLDVWTPSRLHIYYLERVMEHTVRSDAGAQIRDGIKCVAHQGAPPEAMWPYDTTKFRRKPPKTAYLEGAKHPALEYAAVNQTSAELRAVLAAGYPIAFGFTVYESFESDAVAKTGTVPMPQKHEATVGGHAVVLVGYDDAKEQFLCRNSWGKWGDNGYFTMPYAYVLDSNLASDFWVVRHTQ